MVVLERLLLSKKKGHDIVSSWIASMHVATLAQLSYSLDVDDHVKRTQTFLI